MKVISWSHRSIFFKEGEICFLISTHVTQTVFEIRKKERKILGQNQGNIEYACHLGPFLAPACKMLKTKQRNSHWWWYVKIIPEPTEREKKKGYFKNSDSLFKIEFSTYSRLQVLQIPSIMFLI